MRSKGELEAIERIAAHLPAAPRGQTWIGDDAAVLPAPTGSLLFAIDTVVAGVHADLSLVGVDDLGWKALAVNVSDLAAMGGRPLHAVTAVAGPPGLDLDRLYDGLAQAASEYQCPVVGGDLANASDLVVSVAILGTTDGHAPVLRSGARPGHHVFVTGPLGASAAGLRALRAQAREPAGAIGAHRRPAARLQEGLAARDGGASAMIDVSDGLSIDLGRLADASSVGIALELVPVAEGATLDDALGGGEDYELLFCAPDDGVTAGFLDRDLRRPLRIGACTAEPGRLTLDGELLGRTGFEHRFGGAP
jgi:thiamine-monophosphate kinase